MRNLIGSTLQQYQVQLKIRETGTRVLYKAYDTKTFHTIALDIVKVNVKEPAVLYELLKQQAKKNAELAHPNIPVVTDSGIHEDLIFFVYNFSPLHPLRRLFNKTYTWEELARELVPVTKSLAVAHEHQVFHGFLNPTSIIIDENKTPVLFDFGFEQIISKYLISQFPSSWMNNWGYSYCSPEQLKGGKVDCRSDVYAMGMIVHEWLTGETAFLEESAFATLQKRSSDSAGKLSMGDEVLPTVQKLVRKCLAPEPDERYQTIQELSILFSRAALDLTITNKMVQNPFLITQPNYSLQRWGIAFLAVLLVTVGIVLGFWNKLSLSEIRFERSTLATVTSSVPVKAPISTAVAVQPAVPSPEIAGTIAPSQNPYPLFQNTPLPKQPRGLDTESSDEIVTVALWGVGDVNWLVTSPDGKYVAVGSSNGIFVLDPNDFVLQKHIVTSSSVSTLEFSDDGTRLAVGDEYGLIRIWDTTSWEETASLSGHRLRILDMAFSTDGNRLVSVALDDRLIQWEINAGMDPVSVSTPVSAVTSVVFAPGDQIICTGGNDFKINLWKATDLNLLRTITISSRVVDMVMIPTSTMLVVGGADRQVTLLDIEGNTETRRLSGIRYPLSSVAASPDGKVIAAGDINGGIIVWDRNRTVVWSAPNLEEGSGAEDIIGHAHSMAFRSDSKTLFSGLRNGTLRVFDTLSGNEIVQDQSLDLHAQKIAVSYNSRYAISQNSNGTVKVWDLYGGKYLYEVPGQIMDGNPTSPNNNYFAIAIDPSTVRVYGLSTGKEIYTFNGHQGIKAIRFIQDGTVLAAGSEQKMHVWSMSSGQEMITERIYPGTGCTSIHSLKGDPLFSITKYHHIIATSEGSALCSLQKPDWMKTFFIDDPSGRVAYGGSSKLSVVGAEGAVSEPLEMNGVNHQNIVSVTLHPNGSLLAAAFDDHTIHLWDISSQSEVIRLFGHTNLITDLRFTPDGKLLLSTSMDGTVRLWGIPD
ncbi:MAG: hypothetical protein EHM33_09130 [Chloroflexi bacterium]|nr:MAG: hypothetical protein EHM33_09130 [Chloroflexota bacterium]